MNWPWTPREVKVVVTHEIGPNTLAALTAFAMAMNRRTDAMAGLLPEQNKPEPPPPEKSKADIAFEEWLEAQDWTAEEKDDIFVMRERRLGRRPGTPEQKQRAAEVLAKAGAPGV